MPPKDIPYRNRLLTRQTTSNRVAMVDTLLKGRTRIEDKILRAAKNKKFATSRVYRQGIYKDIQTEYVRLGGDLDKWTEGSILRTSKVYHALAAEDLLLTEADKKVISFTKFSSKHNDEYFSRIHPFSAEKLAAVNVQMNPQLAKMLDTDVRALQSAVVDSFREAQVAGLTSGERWKLLQSKTLEYADDPKSWAFIDKAGRKWQRNSYWNMLNRTVSAQVANQSYNDTLIDEGRDLVQIIGGLSTNSNEGCIKWVGRVVSLTGATSGYPPLQDAIDDGLFHPGCVHYTVYMSPKFEKTAQIIDEQRGTPSPVVEGSRKKPVVKMASADKPKAGAVAKPIVPTFKLADTMKEAEAYTKANLAKSVDFRAINNLENVNAFNRTSARLKQKYGLSKMDDISFSTGTPDAAGMANYKVLKLNNRLMSAPDELSGTKFDKAIYSRFGVSDSYKGTRKIEAITAHETAHTVADQLFGQINGSDLVKKYSFGLSKKKAMEQALTSDIVAKKIVEGDLDFLVVRNYSKNSAKIKQWDKIADGIKADPKSWKQMSEYAFTSNEEMFAEVFTMVEMGETVPTAAAKFIKELVL